MKFFRIMVLLAGIAAPGLPAAASPLDAARTAHREGRLAEALTAYRELIDDPAQPAADRATAANNACVILLDAGRYPQAKAACSTARSMRMQLDDQPRLARTLNNLAAVLEAAGDYAEAMTIYREAVAINTRIGNWESLAINFANLGVLATQTGDFGQALSHYDRVGELARRHADAAWAPEQRRLAAVNRAVVLERIGAFEAALDAIRSVDFDAIGAERAATLHVNTGVIYRNLGDPRRALHEFDLAGKLIAADNHAALSNLWLDRALVRHLNLYDYDGALADYEKALELANRGGKEERLTTLYYLARLHYDRGDYSLSRARYNESLALAESVGSRAAQWSGLEGLARILLAEHRPREAYSNLQQAMALIESTRSGFDPGRLRLEFFGSHRNVYALAVETAWRLLADGQSGAMPAEAFRIAQRAKARELLESLGEPVAVMAETVRAGPDRLFVEYFFGDEHLFAWLYEDDRPTFYRLAESGAVRAAATAAHAELAQSGRASNLQRLSEMLVEPFADRLAGRRRLSIAPDGVLFHLPFELLTASGESLLETHIIDYTPSASVAALLDRRAAPQPSVVFAGFGAPDAADISRYELPELPIAEAELRELDRALPGTHRMALGRLATETAFLDTLSEGARIVHVASHTVFDDRLGPVIVFSPDAESDGLLSPAEIGRSSLNVALTVLAACSTAGGIEDGRAITSLTGALLAAGSSAVLATLWDVDDRYAGYFMKEFYRQLRGGRPPALALKRTKTALRDATAGDDVSWSAFVLMGNTGVLLETRPDYRFLLAGLILLAAAWALRRRLRG